MRIPTGFRTESARNGDGIRADSESLARAGTHLRSTPRHSHATTALRVCRSQVQNGSVVDALGCRRIGLGS